VWDHTDSDVLPFQYGMRLVDDTRPGASIWNLLLRREWGFQERKERQILEQGKIALVYQQRQNEKYAQAMAYEAEFEGLRAVVMNKPLANSMAFDKVFDPTRHDIKVAFGVKGKNLKYSLYSDKPDVDVSEIAKKYGGGGHAGAAGFYSETRVV
jgi:oligoribonuclease NrnB/cAMP/cGMP phosphodiesterase (DHH superfamily)